MRAQAINPGEVITAEIDTVDFGGANTDTIQQNSQSGKILIVNANIAPTGYLLIQNTYCLTTSIINATIELTNTTDIGFAVVGTLNISNNQFVIFMAFNSPLLASPWLHYKIE